MTTKMGGVQPLVPRGQPHLPTRNRTMGEPGQTAGRSSRHYEGHRPDALQGSRWGDGRILLMFQTASDLQPGTLELGQAGLQK